MRKLLIASIATIYAFSLFSTAFAADKTWDGLGGDINWNTGANWGGAAPIANDDLFFDGATQLANNNNIVADTNFDSITFNSGAGAFTLGGNRITLGGNVVNNGGDLQTIDLAMIMAATRTFTAAGNLAVGGILSGAGGLTIEGANALTLSGANTYSGTTTLNGSMLNINNATAVGSGTFTIAGGTTIDNTSIGSIILSNNNLQNWNSDFAFTGTNDLDLGTGAVTMDDSRQVTVNGGTLTVGGVIGDGGNARGLTKAGAGTLTLNGANTFTGDLTMNAGTLNIDNAAAVGIGIFTIAGGTIDNTSGAAITLSTANSKSWNGDFTFNGSNDLDLGAGGIAMNASRQVTVNASNFTVSSSISGIGSTLTKAGAGTLTLSGANTYGGGMTMNAGTLNINNAAAVGTGTLTIAGGTIDNTSGAPMTLNNNVQAWNGDFTFTGTGDIDLGTGAVAMSATRQVTANGGTLTVGGIIGDGGGAFGLTKAGAAGTLTLSGANTYTGTTTVNAGTLNIMNAAATGAAVAFGGAGTVRVGAGLSPAITVTTTANNQGTLTYLGTSTSGGTIGAAGFGLAALNLNGGTFTLGHNVVATDTNANGTATVALNGSRTITGNFTLGGTSTLNVGGNTLTLNGVSGVYTQALNTALAVNVSGVSSGQVAGTGNATVNAGSAVNVSVDTAFIPDGTTYTVVDGAGGGGVNVPTTITGNSAFVTFTGTSVLGDLILTANRTNSFAAIAASVAGNSNAAAAAAALEAAGNDPNATADMLNILNTLEASPANEIAASLETLYPSVDNGTIQASYTALNQSITTIERRLSLVRLAKNTVKTGISTGDETKKGIEVWGEGFGNYLHQYNSGGIDGYKAALWGTTLGADSETIFKDLRAGLNGGYVNGYVNSKNNNNRTVIHSSQVTVYGTYDWSPLYFDGAFSFALNKYLGRRNIRIANDWRTANSEYYGQQYSGYLGMGYTFNKGKGLEVTPLMSMQYMHLHLNTYEETEAGALNLNIDAQDYDLVQSGVGIKFDYPLKWPKFEIIPEFRWIWLHDFIGEMQQSLGNTYQGGGAAFDTYGVRPDRNTHDLGTSLSLNTDFGVSITTSYDCQLREDLLGHSGVVTVKYAF